MGNNPVYNIEIDGNYFTGNVEYVKRLHGILSAASKSGRYQQEAKKFLTALEAMDQSEIEFHIVRNRVVYRGIGKHGETEFDFENNRVLLNFNEYTNADGENYFSALANLAHEIEHGRQFMDGEIGFMLLKVGVKPHSHDQVDERKAVLIGAMVHNFTTVSEQYRYTNVRIESQMKEYWRQTSLDTRPNASDFLNFRPGKSQTLKMMSKFNFKPLSKQVQQRKVNIIWNRPYGHY